MFANVDGLSSSRRCLRSVAFADRLSMSSPCRIGPKHHRGGERITKPSVPGQFVITAICLCREFAIDSGRVHFVRCSIISFYSLRSRKFQKTTKFLWKEGVAAFQELRLISALVGLYHAEGSLISIRVCPGCMKTLSSALQMASRQWLVAATSLSSTLCARRALAMSRLAR